MNRKGDNGEVVPPDAYLPHGELERMYNEMKPDPFRGLRTHLFCNTRTRTVVRLRVGGLVCGCEHERNDRECEAWMATAWAL